jgi:multicomponent Na+:H+ antiporter subunit G
MTLLDWISAALLTVGAVFFLAGTVGLLRFPDIYTRLHALTKIDNLGLGFTVLGLLFRVESAAEALKLVLIWGLALAAGATLAYLIASGALERKLATDRLPGAEP